MNNQNWIRKTATAWMFGMLLTTAAFGQSEKLARFDVPFSFEVDGREMAAGTYELSTCGNTLLVLTSAADRRLAFSRIWNDGELTVKADQPTATLAFVKQGTRYLLSSSELMGRQVKTRIPPVPAKDHVVLYARR